MERVPAGKGRTAQESNGAVKAGWTSCTSRRVGFEQRVQVAVHALHYEQRRVRPAPVRAIRVVDHTAVERHEPLVRNLRQRAGEHAGNTCGSVKH